ncbi:MAG: DUF4270 family protein, partial [Bacteroidota bacterium]
MIKTFHCLRDLMLGLGLIFFGFSCEQAVDIGDLDDNLSEFEVFMLDTFQVQSATFLFDSLATSNSNRLLVGQIQDDRLGKVSSRSFFRVVPRRFEFVPAENASFVSLTLHLNYNYFQGDSTQEQTIEVYELDQELDFPENDNQFFNTSTIRLKEEPIGRYSFFPRPNRGETLEIPLSDLLGQTWLDSLLSEAESFSTELQFLEFFKGICILSKSESGDQMLCFSAQENEDGEATLFLQLLYREGEKESDLFYNLPLINPERQFNQISWDNRDSPLQALLPGESLGSADSNHETHVLGGVGLATKIQFPSIDQFTELGIRSVFQYAELQIKPISGTYGDENPLPANLDLYVSNEQGELLSRVLGLDGFALIPRLEIDREFQENTRYTFDLT